MGHEHMTVQLTSSLCKKIMGLHSLVSKQGNIFLHCQLLMFIL